MSTAAERAAARRYPLVPYHTALIRAYAEKHGVTVAHIGHDAFTGMWTLWVSGKGYRSRGIHETRVLDVIREIKTYAG